MGLQLAVLAVGRGGGGLAALLAAAAVSCTGTFHELLGAALATFSAAMNAVALFFHTLFIIVSIANTMPLTFESG